MEEMNENFDILCLLWPLSLSFMMLRKGLGIMKGEYFEDIMKDVDKKELFSYLIENRIFIGSLSDDELKKYYKYLRCCYKNRFIEKIKKFLDLRNRRKDE